MATKIDSNITGLSYAEESSLKTLPATPIWRALEPNSYNDFGGNYTNVARNPINPNRSIRKGVLTDLESSGGFNSDFLPKNFSRLLQGFCFALAHEKPDTQSFNSAAVTITSVTSSTKTYAAASGLGGFLAGSLVLASGFSEAGNNGLDLVASSTAGTVVGTATKVDEAAPPAGAKLEVVGFQFDSGDASLSASSSLIRLSSTTEDFTTFGLTKGEWIFIGGDSTATTFASNLPGYARISNITADYIDFDETTFTATTDTGSGKTLRIFFGKVIKNELSGSIVRKTYQLERTLGSDSNGVQSEYLVGAIPNELTLNIPTADKLNADLSFVGLDYETRDGATGVKDGTRVASISEDALNTSNDVYRMKMSIFDPSNLNKAALFAYVTDATVVINNGVTANKAIGVLGAFEASAGDFAVSGNLTAYFADVASVAAIRNNSDVSFNCIFANNNAGFVLDIPLMSLGNGRLNVEKDQPITLPIDMNGAQSHLDHTLALTFFSYLPAAAMPV